MCKQARHQTKNKAAPSKPTKERLSNVCTVFSCTTLRTPESPQSRYRLKSVFNLDKTLSKSTWVAAKEKLGQGTGVRNLLTLGLLITGTRTSGSVCNQHPFKFFHLQEKAFKITDLEKLTKFMHPLHTTMSPCTHFSGGLFVPSGPVQTFLAPAKVPTAPSSAQAQGAARGRGEGGGEGPSGSNAKRRAARSEATAPPRKSRVIWPRRRRKCFPEHRRGHESCDDGFWRRLFLKLSLDLQPVEHGNPENQVTRAALLVTQPGPAGGAGGATPGKERTPFPLCLGPRSWRVEGGVG